MRPRISIRGSVRPCDRMSVCPYVRMSVRYHWGKTAENDDFSLRDASYYPPRLVFFLPLFFSLLLPPLPFLLFSPLFILNWSSSLYFSIYYLLNLQSPISSYHFHIHALPLFHSILFLSTSTPPSPHRFSFISFHGTAWPFCYMKFVSWITGGASFPYNLLKMHQQRYF